MNIIHSVDERIDSGNDTHIDIISQNYNGMNEIGKEKLKAVAEQLFKIWATVNKKPAGAKGATDVARKK